MYICLNSRCKNIICTKINPHISLGLSSAFWRLVHLLDTLAEHCRDGDGVVGELLNSLALQGRVGSLVLSSVSTLSLFTSCTTLSFSFASFTGMPALSAFRKSFILIVLSCSSDSHISGFLPDCWKILVSTCSSSPSFWNILISIAFCSSSHGKFIFTSVSAIRKGVRSDIIVRLISFFYIFKFVFFRVNCTSSL